MMTEIAISAGSQTIPPTLLSRGSKCVFFADPDILHEARSVIHAFSDKARVRLIGSTAVWIYSRWDGGFLFRSERRPRDIDLVYCQRSFAIVAHCLEAMGYKVDRTTLIASEGRRLRAVRASYTVDGFADPLEFRQRLRIGERITKCSPSLPLIDILLLKLQIDPLSDADVIDALLIASVGVGDNSCRALDAGRVSELAGASWRWWSAIANAVRVIETNSRLANLCNDSEKEVLSARVHALKCILQDCPKTLSWHIAHRLRRFLPAATPVDEI